MTPYPDVYIPGACVLSRLEAPVPTLRILVTAGVLQVENPSADKSNQENHSK